MLLHVLMNELRLLDHQAYVKLVLVVDMHQNVFANQKQVSEVQPKQLIDLAGVHTEVVAASFNQRVNLPDLGPDGVRHKNQLEYVSQALVVVFVYVIWRPEQYLNEVPFEKTLRCPQANVF